MRKYDRRFKATRLRLLKREIIFQHLADGMHVTEIADKYQVCRVRLGDRIRWAVNHMGARSRVQAVAIGIRQGWIK